MDSEMQQCLPDEETGAEKVQKWVPLCCTGCESKCPADRFQRETFDMAEFLKICIHTVIP
jgi:hypothetical protein